MHKAAVQNNLQSRHVLEDVEYMVLETLVLYAAPEDSSNLVRLPEAVVYFIKFDCSPCMFMLFAAHVCEFDYKLQRVGRSAAVAALIQLLAFLMGVNAITPIIRNHQPGARSTSNVVSPVCVFCLRIQLAGSAFVSSCRLQTVTINCELAIRC